MLVKGLDLITESRRQCINLCRRKHLLSYLLGYRKEREATPLRFGSAWHWALEERGNGVPLADICAELRARYKVMPDWAEQREWLTECEQIIALLVGYDWYWGKDGIEVLQCEGEYSLPIRNPRTGRPTTSYRLAGKMDKIVRLGDARLAIMEHKTTSKSIEDPDADYWKAMRLSQQVTSYLWAAREQGIEVETVVLDAVHKPGMSPLNATPEEKRKYTKAGLLYANQRAADEPLVEYSARLVEDIHKRPEHYYARQELPRTNGDIAEFLDELWQQQKVMRDAELNNRHYRNTEACTARYRCEHLDTCHYDLDYLSGPPPGFVQLEWAHPELEDLKSAATEDATNITTLADGNGQGITVRDA